MSAILSKLWPHLLAVAAILGFAWWIDHRAAVRARAEMEAAASRSENRTREELRASEQRLSAAISDIGRAVGAQIGAIDVIHKTEIRPTLVKELARETRFTDPAAGLSDGVREQINRALAAVACSPRAGGGIECAVRDGRPVGDQ